jgi:hypothetical protein
MAEFLFLPPAGDVFCLNESLSKIHWHGAAAMAAIWRKWTPPRALEDENKN